MFDEGLTEFEKQLREQILRNWKNYRKHRFDLSIARTKQQYNISGKYISVPKVSSESAQATIAFNDKDNDDLDLEKDVEIETFFKSFFITNTAQSDEWIDLIFGADFRYIKTGQGIGGGGGITLANNEIPVKWSGAGYKSIAASGNATSDVVTFSTNSSFAHLQIMAGNDGTPGPGDTVDFFLLLSCGDVDGSDGDDYDTINHALPVGTLDTNAENPVRRTVNCPITKGCKLYVKNNSTADQVTVAALILERTMS